MKCYAGTILSVDANNGVYRYLVEDKGRIGSTENSGCFAIF